MGVPAQRRGAVAALQFALHQRTVRGFVGGLDQGQLVPLCTGAQQLEVGRLQTLARGLGPRFVARPGQQVADVVPGRLGTCGGVAPRQRGFGRTREFFGIHHHQPLGPQRHLAALHHDSILPPQRLPRMVGGLAQVGGASLGVELWPQRVDHLLSRQAPPRLQAEQLHQVRGAQAWPALCREFLATDAGRKTAEQVDLQRLGGIGRWR